MFDPHLRRHIDAPLNAIARFLTKRGISANVLTAIGFIFSLCVFAALSFRLYHTAILFIILGRLMDGLDGPLARQTRPTDLGGYLDIVSDFIFYAGTVFFFAVGQPDIALSAAFLIFSFMGTGSSFLAYAIVAAKHGLNHDRQGKKSFFYIGGIAEGAETNAVLILICLLPHTFPVIAYVFGALCWLTTLGRVGQAVRDFREKR